jgi:phenylalanyl-tRNA synthetase beta chain
MLVSWKWLQQYVDLPLGHAEVAQRLSLSGLNHESTDVQRDDVVIDLEVTSNRGDCLSHIGVAREIAALYDLSLRIPDPHPIAKGPAISSAWRVDNEYVDACPRYTARIVRGISVKPSPPWLADRLRAINVAVINNIVDITNWVLFECGQPLHAFDIGRLQGSQIRVRRAAQGESFAAIDHRTYTLSSDMCVIADAHRPIAIGGVMGGAESEVAVHSRDILIESAIFTPMSIRKTARALRLHSAASHRFERRVNPVAIDWASRRCAELVLQLAGGTLDEGVIDTHASLPPRAPITLSLGEIERVLGIHVDSSTVHRILTRLGCSGDGNQWVPPPWRHDLTREVDLIEEVARIDGYEKIPDNVPVPVISSRRRAVDELLDIVRMTLVAGGFHEAMTPSVVPESLDQLGSPWTSSPSLASDTSMLEGARFLRRSILPSLLASRRANLAASGADASLFEVARIYLPHAESVDGLPRESVALAMVSGRDPIELKGVIESMLQRLRITPPLVLEPMAWNAADPSASATLMLGDQPLGYLATLSDSLRKSMKLDRLTSMAELSVERLLSLAQLTPQFMPVSPYPTIERDLNLIMDESIAWSNLATTVRRAAGPRLTELRYRETYRDAKKDGPGRKRILLTLELRKHDGTLTGTEADAITTSVVEACRAQHQAQLM